MSMADNTILLTEILDVMERGGDFQLGPAGKHRALPQRILAAIKKSRRLRDFIDSEIVRIEVDSRYQAKPALVQVNAPLALIQVEMKARRQALREIRAQLEGRT
jgi:hypothetical protein